MTSFQGERLACAYFFAIPGLIYGIFTSRLPALKAMAHANDGQIGLLLLALGGASFIGLLSSGYLVERVGARKIMGAGSVLFALFLTVASLACSYWHLVLFCMLGGFAGGLCEVAMNTQGIDIESRYQRLCMASLHACFSLGGAAGSLGGSLFAWLGYSPFINFLVMGIAYISFAPIAYGRLFQGESRKRQTAGPAARLPLFIYLCGLMSMLCYVSEGSVGEWGSILLHSDKGAPQSQAALVFACFCSTMVIFRFAGDRLRLILGDFRIVLFGGILGCLCMSVVLLSASPVACLCAYAAMGMGFAPIVPVLFSRAGTCPGVSAARASAAVSVMSYTGLLAFPPFLGMLGDRIGLGNALWIIAGACLAVALGSPLLRKRSR